jgi:membrane fusion protein, multidrug efflux system
MKKSAWVFILIIMAGAGVVWVRHSRTDSAANSPAKNAPIPVLLAKSTLVSLPEEIRSFGTVEPMLTVSIKSQITGVLSNVLFTEGQDVREGELLFLIDPRPAETALRQAEATLTRDRVQLANAQTEAARQEVLLAKGISAEDIRDAAVTAARTLKASVQADDAMTDAARLQLGYCSIRSPISGRTGTLLIHRGNLVKANDAALVTINQTQPVLIRFTLPQQELARIRASTSRGNITVKATPPGLAGRMETGIVSFIDNAVDETTGTIQLKARFDNADSTLWPGQFVSVVIQFAQPDGVVTVPETAIMPGQKGAYVYVKDATGKVFPRPVVTDRTVGGLTVIVQGLTADEDVVVDGQLRLKPGALVTPQADPKAVSKPAGQP